jgi:hypothetical protein
MKTATLSELKKELNTISPKQLLNLCMRLAKYKKDNKELLTYLLFEAENEQAYVKGIKLQMDEQFSEMNKSNNYLAKKGLRKILRSTNKFIKYSDSKETEAELLLYFCSKVKKSGIRIDSNTVLNNLYQQQLKKIDKVLSSLHEDLQYDYKKELERL